MKKITNDKKEQEFKDDTYMYFSLIEIHLKNLQSRVHILEENLNYPYQNED